MSDASGSDGSVTGDGVDDGRSSEFDAGAAPPTQDGLFGRRPSEVVPHSRLVGLMAQPISGSVPIRRSTVMMVVAFLGFGTLLYLYPPAASVSDPATGNSVVVPGVIVTTTTTTHPATTTTTHPATTTTTHPVVTTTTTNASSTTTTVRPSGGATTTSHPGTTTTSTPKGSVTTTTVPSSSSTAAP